jgi:hypothetical protein
MRLPGDARHRPRVHNFGNAVLGAKKYGGQYVKEGLRFDKR